jgi:hypothetical protein
VGRRVLVPGLVSALVLVVLFVVLRPDAPDTAPAERSFDIGIGGGGMSPGEVSAREGDRVTMGFASDRPVEVHVHGYDLEREVGPGETAELSFEADLTGRFPIEDHETEKDLGVLVVEPR